MITTLRERYPELVIGLSDHQDGIAMAPVAYMLGARVIEKHFTLSHTAKGTDHAFSLMPEGCGSSSATCAASRRDRRRRQAAAPERGKAAGEDGQEARRRPRPAFRVTCSPRETSLRSRQPTKGCRRTVLDDLLGQTLVRPLAEEEAILASDVVQVPTPATTR